MQFPEQFLAFPRGHFGSLQADQQRALHRFIFEGEVSHESLLSTQCSDLVNLCQGARVDRGAMRGGLFRLRPRVGPKI